MELLPNCFQVVYKSITNLVIDLIWTFFFFFKGPAVKPFSLAVPVDAPLRVYLLNGWVLSVLICNLRTVKFSPVYMDEDGWRSYVLARWSSTPDLTSISPVEHRQRKTQNQYLGLKKGETNIFSSVTPRHNLNTKHTRCSVWLQKPSFAIIIRLKKHTKFAHFRDMHISLSLRLLCGICQATGQIPNVALLNPQLCDPLL